MFVICSLIGITIFFHRNIHIFATRLAVVIIINAAGAGFAAPSVLVTRPVSRVSVEWLPMDNQTLYRLEEGESRK